MMLAANSANQGDNKVARSGRNIWSKWASKTRTPKQEVLRWRMGVPSEYKWYIHAHIYIYVLFIYLLIFFHLFIYSFIYIYIYIHVSSALELPGLQPLAEHLSAAPRSAADAAAAAGALRARPSGPVGARFGRSPLRLGNWPSKLLSELRENHEIWRIIVQKSSGMIMI